MAITVRLRFKAKPTRPVRKDLREVFSDPQMSARLDVLLDRHPDDNGSVNNEWTCLKRRLRAAISAVSEPPSLESPTLLASEETVNAASSQAAAQQKAQATSSASDKVLAAATSTVLKTSARNDVERLWDSLATEMETSANRQHWGKFFELLKKMHTGRC
jgi:hypothetical protein